MVPLQPRTREIPNSKEAYSNCARPARDVEVEQVDVRRSANDVQRSNTLSDAQKDQLRSEQTVHVPVLLRNPVLREKGPGRPQLTEQNTTERTTPSDNVDDRDTTSTTSDNVDDNVDDRDTTSTTFTENEINVLACARTGVTNQNNISGNLLDLNTKRGRYMFNHDLSYLLILVNDSLWNPVFNDIPVISALHVEPASPFPLANAQLFNGFRDN